MARKSKTRFEWDTNYPGLLRAIRDKDYECDLDDEYGLAREQFAWMWESTLKKDDLDRYGWWANPWVWVIEFERCGL